MSPGLTYCWVDLIHIIRCWMDTVKGFRLAVVPFPLYLYVVHLYITFVFFFE